MVGRKRKGMRITDDQILAVWDRHRESGLPLPLAVVATVRDIIENESLCSCGHSARLHVVGSQGRCAAERCRCGGMSAAVQKLDDGKSIARR